MENTNQEMIKPLMSSTEASWHETQAGQRAKAETLASGADNMAMQTIADCTLPPNVVAGYEIKPATLGTINALQEVARAFEKFAVELNLHSSDNPNTPGMRQLVEIALAVMVFSDAKRCYQMVRALKIEDLYYEAEAMVWDMPIEIAMSLTQHFAAEMDRVKKLNANTGETKSASQPGKE
jgi:hypothetical protein